MKNFVIFISLIFVCSCNAQSPIYTLGSANIPSNIPNNAYIKDNNNLLNKFVGTWKYENNGKVFTITLQKVMQNLNAYYKDMLKGSYIYNNGILSVADTTNYPVNDSQLTGAILWEGNSNKVSLYFYDSERPKMSCKVTLTYSNINGVEKLHWNLKMVGKLPKLPYESIPQFDFRVPTNIELTKQ